MTASGECDCCGRSPLVLTRCWVTGIETFACDECRGVESVSEYDLPDGCTCSWVPSHSVNSMTIDPPFPVLRSDPWCPVHGKDPDDERDRRIEEANAFLDRWEDR